MPAVNHASRRNTRNTQTPLTLPLCASLRGGSVGEFDDWPTPPCGGLMPGVRVGSFPAGGNNNQVFTPGGVTQRKERNTVNIETQIRTTDRSALCAALGITPGELSRKISGNDGFLIGQLSPLLTACGYRLCGPDEIPVNQHRAAAMEFLLEGYMTGQFRRLQPLGERDRQADIENKHRTGEL